MCIVSGAFSLDLNFLSRKSFELFDVLQKVIHFECPKFFVTTLNFRFLYLSCKFEWIRATLEFFGHGIFPENPQADGDRIKMVVAKAYINALFRMHFRSLWWPRPLEFPKQIISDY